MSSLTHLRPNLDRLTALARRTANPGAGRSDPSERLFAGIRMRLILWYSGVLAVILVLAGLLLYVGMREVLLHPVGDLLNTGSTRLARDWAVRGGPPFACLPGRLSQSAPLFVACYDQTGAEISNNALGDLAPGFLGPTAARAALAGSGVATDTVDGGNGYGAIQRQAVVVRDPAGHQAVGVVVVGWLIQGDIDALNKLLALLLAVGALTLAGSGIGGILLARRALVPARLALARQRAFTADASHELRTPLTLLRADAEVLLSERERFTDDDAALLDDIVAETEHLGALAANLLDLARLDSGTYHLEQEVVDLDEVAEQVARRVRTLAEQRSIALDVRGGTGTLVIGDRTWLSQAALILVDNALKYNAAGGMVTVRAYRDGNDAALEVTDTGMGIGAEHLPHLGERFYRVDKARSREMGGAGLGLAIARSIAAEHHGSLTFTSEPGTGTTATLRLPAVGSIEPAEETGRVPDSDDVLPDRVQ
ncbi:MAG TPA: ATP-binding protein [Ktedonobacterales bacterium]